ncbi:glycosyltransferase 87 family protein [Corynebacterium sp.]|uniref:glycosyltransferase 87 family protein n=1 Tax=Corynebacterium sp. TaxID=1720 RepID=UPI0026DBC958|nr:glycosyltransferase 87 family protein [Corynebacterium sp.]MDO5032294.1 glycosyltransferase 87 family protein [Corynebacterium sp.]
MTKKLYGISTLLVTMAALFAVIVYRFHIFDGLNAFTYIMPFDLRIYQLAGEDLLAGGNLYDNPYIANFPFTYPPFAGLVFMLLPALGDSLIIAWPAAIYAALLAIIIMILRERGVRITPAVLLVAVALTALTPANESIHGTQYYGQINVFLMLLVAFDLLPLKWRLPGVGTGLAAGLKLTPAYMGLALLFERRWWAALGSIITFLVTVIIGFMFVPDAKVFWTDAMFNSSRVGEHANPGAKSLRSLMYRVFGIDGGVWWILAVLAVFALTCLALRTAYKHGNRSAALAMTGLSACLVSPFSWYHHFIWTVPFGIVVFVATNQALGTRLTGRFGAQLAGLLSVLALVVVELPFMSAPVWFAASSGNLDHIESFQPWAMSLWTMSCVIYIAAYAAWGFISPKSSTASTASTQGRHAAA